jgi:hypothetical protein
VAAIYPALRFGFGLDGNAASFWAGLKLPTHEEPACIHAISPEWREDEV